jgi:hypothetical protein
VEPYEVVRFRIYTVKVLRRIVRTLAMILAAIGCTLFLMGALLTFDAIHHNMQWIPVEASLICAKAETAKENVCHLEYFANGQKFTQEHFRSASLAEGTIRKQKLYYWKSDPANTSRSRDCGLGVFTGNLTAFVGLMTSLPCILLLRFWLR